MSKRRLGVKRRLSPTRVVHLMPARLAQADIDAIGRQLGFVVSEGGLWRLEDRVVVAQVQHWDDEADNELPGHIRAMEADGRITVDDQVRAIYVYEANTAAVQRLFRTIVDDGRARHQPRLLSFDALHDLGQQVRTKRLSPADARSVLFADLPRVGLGPSGP